MFLEVVNFSKIYEKIQEAKTLQAYILETETRLTQASAQLVSAGIKTSNIKKIVQDIDVSGKPINQIFFKNTNGVLSFSLVQINQAFDQQMRTILGPLLGRSITVAAIDKPKRNQIALISKEVAKYGMKSSDFNNLLKKIFQITSNQEYVVYTSDGYIVSFDAEETPVGGGGGNGGDSGSGGGGTVVSPPRIGFIIEGQDSRMSFFEVSNGGVFGGTDGIRSNSYIAITTPFSNSESPFVRMSFSVTDTPESWGPAQGYVGSRFSYSKNVGVEYMYYSGEGYNPASSPVGVMDLIPDEELSGVGNIGVLQGQTLHVGVIRSSDGIIPGLYNIKVEYINRNQAELGNYTPYYEKNFYFTIRNLSNGNGYGQYDQYSQYDEDNSLLDSLAIIMREIQRDPAFGDTVIYPNFTYDISQYGFVPRSPDSTLNSLGTVPSISILNSVAEGRSASIKIETTLLTHAEIDSASVLMLSVDDSFVEVEWQEPGSAYYPYTKYHVRGIIDFPANRVIEGCKLPLTNKTENGSRSILSMIIPDNADWPFFQQFLLTGPDYVRDVRDHLGESEFPRGPSQSYPYKHWGRIHRFTVDLIEGGNVIATRMFTIADINVFTAT